MFKVVFNRWGKDFDPEVLYNDKYALILTICDLDKKLGGLEKEILVRLMNLSSFALKN